MANLTAYLNDVKAKLGNQVVVNRNGNTTYKVLTSTVEEYKQLEVVLPPNPSIYNAQIDGIMTAWYNDGVTFVPPTYEAMQAAWDTRKAQPTKADMGLEPKLIGTYPFANIPDAVANSLKLILDRKLWEYNLNKGVVTPKP